MSNLARILLSSIDTGPPSGPRTLSYSGLDFAKGFTGPVNMSDPLKIYIRGGLTLWVGWITGTSAKLKMAATVGTPSALVSVSIDNGDFTDALLNDGEYTLFDGLDTKRFVQIRTARGAGDTSYTDKTSPVLKIAGDNPSMVVPSGIVSTDSYSNLGVYNGTTTLNVDGFSPKIQLRQNATVGSNIGSFRIRGAFTNLLIVTNGSSKVGVSKNGDIPTYYETQVVGVDSPSKCFTIPCDGSTSTYNVWDGGNIAASGCLSVAVDAPLLDIGTPRKMDQYGDSVTFGHGPGATPVNTETMGVAAHFGLAGSTNGISGLRIDGCLALLDEVLPRKTITPNDIAVLAIGGNNDDNVVDPKEQADYSLLIDNLLSAGYGTVLVRGIIYIKNAGAIGIIDTANAIFKDIVDSKADPRIKWVDVKTWTNYTAEDGVHPDASGYLSLREYAINAYTPLI